MSVKIELLYAEAERFRDGIADILCWSQGFTASSGETEFSPPALDVMAEVIAALRQAIDKGDDFECEAPPKP